MSEATFSIAAAQRRTLRDEAHLKELLKAGNTVIINRETLEYLTEINLQGGNIRVPSAEEAYKKALSSKGIL
jgi:hypothetical protein